MLIFSVTALVACSKNTATNQSTIHTGKVLKSMCGCIAVQFTDGTSLGQNGWYDPSEVIHTYYDHIFKVANPCTWGGPSANSTFHFRFAPPSAQTCVMCMIFSPTPDTAYTIETVNY